MTPLTTSELARHMVCVCGDRPAEVERDLDMLCVPCAEQRDAEDLANGWTGHESPRQRDEDCYGGRI